MSISPYSDLPTKAFWRPGLVEQNPESLKDIYSPKFYLAKDAPIAAAGSCFAQHISRHLRRAGFEIIDVEPPPVGLSGKDVELFGYGLYSARYGNIYTVRQLLQLVKESLLDWRPNDFVWEKNGRFYDAFRPSIEPNGFLSSEEVCVHRAEHVNKVKKLFKSSKLFIFTLGLTESWIRSSDGCVFPTAPGVVAGNYDEQKFEFHNFSFEEIRSDLFLIIKVLRDFNPDIKFIFTVSPVPLTATSSGQHVLVASTYSKSLLRSVVAEVVN